mmetsp:Transcript_5842/g.9262  ORF Transcript_5842/g.9262 Transcript_5842/m.9262 type:complete len:148 (+) Transcript_5842:425-868(+)
MVRWANIIHRKDIWGEIKWPTVKRAERTLEKLKRTYGNDVSCLVDLARYSIVFETVEDLADCVRSIHKDEEMIIDKIKNRYSRKYDSGVSFGYRDIAINVRVFNDLTEQYGCQNHVCELQLILRKFAEVKTDSGHRRYVHLRNMQCA